LDHLSDGPRIYPLHLPNDTMAQKIIVTLFDVFSTKSSMFYLH